MYVFKVVRFGAWIDQDNERGRRFLSCKDLYHGAAILIFLHSNQCNQTEVRRNSLVPFLGQDILALRTDIGLQG